MKRQHTHPRQDWQAIVADSGMRHDSALWDESVYYELSQSDVDEISAATSELHFMALQAVQHVIDQKLYAELGIPAAWVPLIEASWKRRDGDIVGRLDLAFDAIQPPKLIEYNADGPSMILETGWLQKAWLEEKFPDEPLSQFTTLHDALIARFQEVLTRRHVHFACKVSDLEMLSNTIYVRELANAGGCTTVDINVDDLGWDSVDFNFVDLNNNEIDYLYKFYPWDWMLKEKFGEKLYSEPFKGYEPVWKVLLTSKGILKMMWKLFKDHPNLLPASHMYIDVGHDYVTKPLFGREGFNVTLHKGTETQRTGGIKESDQILYQGIAPIPCIEGRYPIVSSFIVGDKAVGIGIREDASLISTGKAAFVPHVIK